MLEFLTIISKATGPFWNSLRRKLAEEKIAPITITHAPNLFGHPLGIAALALSGTFLLPHDRLFFVYWFGMIAISGVISTFVILGLLQTKFFTTQIIGSLGFVSSSLCAAFFLGEELHAGKIVALCVAVVGVVIFSWKGSEHKLALDRGMIFTILAVLLSGFASILYKLATFHVPDYGSLLTGRFIGDLIGWTVVWLISLWLLRKNPAREMKDISRTRHGQIYIIGLVATTFLDTWLIYKLPVQTLAILGTIAFPITYFLSSYLYKERITRSMWIGTAFIIGSIIVFLTFA